MSPLHCVAIELDDYAWEHLSAEAERQGVTPKALVEHATLYYLADLDSGRAALKVFRDALRERGFKRKSRFTRPPSPGPPHRPH